MSNILALLIISAVYYIGEFVGTKTKAWIPSVFVTAILFLIGYWTFFPKDIVTLAGLGAPLGGLLVIMLCITHMGTIISIKQLLEQWKVIVITLAGLVGMVAACWLICVPTVGKEYVVSGLPPLTGGIVAATMMNQAALEKGLTSAAVLAIAMYVCQGFAGYPLTAILLKKEGKKLLKGFRSGAIKAEESVTDIDASAGNLETKESEKKRLIPPMPQKYMTTAFVLLKLMIAVFIANKLGTITGLNQAVWALILGIVLTEIGFLDKDSLNKANSYGFLMFVLMVYVFSGLKDATPAILLEAAGPMAVIIIVGVAGMGIASMIAGKILGISWNMAYAVSLTALYGFPPNYILTEECVKALTNTEEEHKFLMDRLLPMMIVGGFITVTITSVIVAGIFINML
ncbi:MULTISPECIES: hypothetical protein [unclassified Sedimentibacter]|uniref:hypothetical protein n=1 Tax=unclassified Sedimentibacter TaxID=2649220 RepID=UPI0027E20014|nr:hypothetical protein [Sedimentibacter sp. MB35-C1]WMJ77632.1 hypothetical protein RBQ61_01525 [Sedimentibacter sp. MB35-C1]